MIDPMTAALIAQTAVAAGQKFSSSIKRRKAERAFNNYKIPQSANTMLDVARNFAMEKEVPGAELYRNRALGSAARAVEAAQRTAEAPSDVLAVLGRAYGRDYMDFEKNLATMSTENRMRGRSAYMSALDRMTQLETQRWELTELMPYMQKMNESGQLEAASGANLQSALSSGAMMWNASEAMKNEQGMFDKWLEWQKGGGGLAGSNPYRTTSSSSGFSTPMMDFSYPAPPQNTDALPTFDPSTWRYDQQVNRFSVKTPQQDSTLLPFDPSAWRRNQLMNRFNY